MEQSLWSANSSCPCSKEPRGRRELFFEAGSERTTSQVRPNRHSPTFRVLTSSVTVRFRGGCTLRNLPTHVPSGLMRHLLGRSPSKERHLGLKRASGECDLT